MGLEKGEKKRVGLPHVAEPALGPLSLYGHSNRWRSISPLVILLMVSPTQDNGPQKQCACLQKKDGMITPSKKGSFFSRALQDGVKTTPFTSRNSFTIV